MGEEPLCGHQVREEGEEEADAPAARREARWQAEGRRRLMPPQPAVRQDGRLRGGGG